MILIYEKEFSGYEKCSLQSAIKSEFNQYLDKTATLAEWACGIDLALGKYLPEQAVEPERTWRIQEEKIYRTI
jgi:hypothetical protein